MGKSVRKRCGPDTLGPRSERDLHPSPFLLRSNACGRILSFILVVLLLRPPIAWAQQTEFVMTEGVAAIINNAVDRKSVV